MFKLIVISLLIGIGVSGIFIFGFWLGFIQARNMLQSKYNQRINDLSDQLILLKNQIISTTLKEQQNTKTDIPQYKQ